MEGGKEVSPSDVYISFSSCKLYKTICIFSPESSLISEIFNFAKISKIKAINVMDKISKMAKFWFIDIILNYCIS